MLAPISEPLDTTTGDSSERAEPAGAWTADMVAMMIGLSRNVANTQLFRWTAGNPDQRVKVSSDTGMSFSVSISDGDVWRWVAFVATLDAACDKAAELLNTPDNNHWWPTRSA